MCCVLGQDALLSQCLSLPKSINCYQWQPNKMMTGTLHWTSILSKGRSHTTETQIQCKHQCHVPLCQSTNSALLKTVSYTLCLYLVTLLSSESISTPVFVIFSLTHINPPGDSPDWHRSKKSTKSSV